MTRDAWKSMDSGDYERELRRVRRERDNARAALKVALELGVISQQTTARIRAIAAGMEKVDE